MREAIVNANNSIALFVRITFNIAGPNRTISPLSELPSITRVMTIDGTTQPGYAGAPLIELSGTRAGLPASGLISEAPVTIRGLVINEFSSWGIALIAGSDGSIIAGNYIGTNAAGNAKRGNGHGILIASANNTIGGTTEIE
jgi:hypothetical protein